MKILLICLMAVFGFVATSNAQSIFKSLPHPNKRAAAALSINDTMPPGMNYQGFRFTGPTVLYAVNFSPLSVSSSTVFTFVGIDYEKDVWNASANRFYTSWAIGLQGGEGGQVAPNTLSAVTAAALTVSTQQVFGTTLPFKVTLGLVYNFTTNKFMPSMGPGVSLNN